MTITPNQWTILERLEKGPEWIRSFQPAKPLLDDLIAKGLVERCRPHLGRGNNMVRLTAAGCEALDIEASDVPANRERKPFVDKPPLVLGQIKAGLSNKVRSVCETFVRAVEAGERVPEIVEGLAAREDVQRPAIWKRLRMGGLFPEYGRRQGGGKGRPAGGGIPGYTARLREKSDALRRRTIAEIEAMPRVDRDPCPRCGVRADLGCSHTRALVGMSFQ